MASGWLRRRGERVERSFAHTYDTGGMRRTHLRGTTNILKRVLVHVSGFNLGLVMRRLLGVGTPRGLQGRVIAVILCLVSVRRPIMAVVDRSWTPSRAFKHPPSLGGASLPLSRRCLEISTCTTGC